VVFAALVVLWYAVRKATKKASLASFAVIIGLRVGVAVSGRAGWEVAAVMGLALLVMGLALLVMVRHVDNFKRLLAGNELSATKS
jgi:glycerol-3-phosphate acyltransferase PlsY